MKKYLQRGFTLIELLVVIAIIGILSSVVLASLSAARNKGADAAVKNNLANARAGAELFYDTGTTYSGVCAGAVANSINPMVMGAARSAGVSNGTVGTTGTAYSAAGTPNAVCHDSATGWAAMVSLKNPTAPNTNGGWCVDSTGQAREAVTLSANSVICAQ